MDQSFLFFVFSLLYLFLYLFLLFSLSSPFIYNIKFKGVLIYNVPIPKKKLNSLYIFIIVYTKNIPTTHVYIHMYNLYAVE